MRNETHPDDGSSVPGAGLGQSAFPGAEGMPFDALADSAIDLTKAEAKARQSSKNQVSEALEEFKKITSSRTGMAQPEYLKLSRLGLANKTELIKAIGESVPDVRMFKIAGRFDGFKVLPLLKSEPSKGAGGRPVYTFALGAEEVSTKNGAASFWYKVQMNMADELTQKLGVPLSNINFVVVTPKTLTYLRTLVDLRDGEDARHRALLKQLETTEVEVFGERKITQYTDKREAPKLFAEILAIGIKVKATDIHIEPDDPGRYMVRYRINGQLVRWDSISRSLAESVSAIIKGRSNIDPSERRMPHDGRIAFLDSDLKMASSLSRVDVRVSTAPLCSGESIVLRLLEKNKSEASFDLESLGFPPRIIQDIREILRQPNGLVLVTGPTGSGKTTTLYSVLRELDDGTRKIVTVEDPVEMDLRGLSQAQVRRNPSNDDHDLTFNKLLRSILRQDPDIILIGEIRDSETAEIAIRAALTGHLVFSTLHTNDSFAVVKRLVSQGVSQNLLQGSLRGVLSQRLIPVLCDKCKVVVEDPAAELFKQTGVKISGSVTKTLYAPTIANGDEGDCCEHCHGSGFSTRTVVPECWTVTGPVLDEIFNNKEVSESDLYTFARKEGFIPMADEIVRLVAEGQTTFEKAIGIACSKGQINDPALQEKIKEVFSQKEKS